MNIKKGVVYVFIANIINLIAGLFTGFVLPKFLSIDSYASIRLFQLYITYVEVLHFGFADGMYLNYGGKTVQQIETKEILAEFKTFKIFQLIVSIIAIALSLILKNEILLFCSLVILPINVRCYLRNLYQAIGEFEKYSRITNINTLLLLCINFILVFIVKSNNYYVYIASYILIYVIYWIIIEKENSKLFKKEKSKADKKYLINNIKTGFLLMTGNFCSVMFTSIDRLFVQNIFGAIKFAFYSFAVSADNLLNIFITPISTVMYNYLCNNTQIEKVVKIKKLILIFSTVVITIAFPAKLFIEMWIPKYIESINVLFLLFSAQFISIIVKCIHLNLYKAQKKQNRYFAIMLIVVILSAILDIIFYYIYNSIEMIALATLAANIIWFVIGEVNFSKYKLKIREYIYIFLIVILFLACAYIKNAIVGMLVYAVTSLFLICLLMPSTLKYSISMLKEYINKIKKVITKKQLFL